MSLSEFSIIEQFARRVSNPGPEVRLGIGDDGAVLAVPAGMELVVSMDTLVEGVHFLPDTDARSLGYKVLAVNLSDLAAMGAEPAWATLSLTLPESNSRWVEEFADGFFTLAERHCVTLIGGDVTRGPLNVTVQVHGLMPAGTALRRAGAKAGDGIYVTGTLGDGGLGLWVAERGDEPASDNDRWVLGRWRYPEPRVAAGMALRGIANACIDVSDGLLADLGHVVDTSGVGAVLQVHRVPLSDAYKSLLDKMPGEEATDPYRLPLTAGDDYELCFTVPVAAQTALAQAFKKTGVGYTRIGEIHAGSGIRCIDENGGTYKPTGPGYQHFS